MDALTYFHCNTTNLILSKALVLSLLKPTEIETAQRGNNTENQKSVNTPRIMDIGFNSTSPLFVCFDICKRQTSCYKHIYQLECFLGNLFCLPVVFLIIGDGILKFSGYGLEDTTLRKMA